MYLWRKTWKYSLSPVKKTSSFNGTIMEIYNFLFGRWLSGHFLHINWDRDREKRKEHENEAYSSYKFISKTFGYVSTDENK